MPSFMRKISIIGRCAMIYRAQQLKETGLSGVHLSYILTLCRHPGMSQEQIARHIYINKSNVTRHLAQLQQSDLSSAGRTKTTEGSSLSTPLKRPMTCCRR